MNQVEVFGIRGHQRSQLLLQRVRQGLRNLGIGLPIREVNEVDRIMEADISATPALRINGRIVLQQVVPDQTAMTDLLATVLVPNTKAVKMKKLIVPTDFTIASQNAFHFALELAPLLGATVKVVHVYSGLFSTQDAGMVVRPGMGRREVLLEQLSHFVQPAIANEEGGVAAPPKALVEYELLSGNTAHQLVHLSASEDVEMIIMGHNSGLCLSDRLFGSVISYVARNAKTKVMLIPEQHHFSGFKQVLIGSNYQIAKQELLGSIMQFTNHFQSTLHFVHVHDGKANDNYAAVVNDLLDAFFMDGPPTFRYRMTTIRASNVAEGLNNYINKENIDLSILVHSRRDILDRLLRPSQTQAMLGYTEVPLLIYYTGE